MKRKRRKRVQTHLVLKEMEVRRVDERVRRRTCFYTALALPQAYRHCMTAVIFQQTHLKNKIFYVVLQVVFWFLSTCAVISFPHFQHSCSAFMC